MSLRLRPSRSVFHETKELHLTAGVATSVSGLVLRVVAYSTLPVRRPALLVHLASASVLSTIVLLLSVALNQRLALAVTAT